MVAAVTIAVVLGHRRAHGDRCRAGYAGLPSDVVVTVVEQRRQDHTAGSATVLRRSGHPGQALECRDRRLQTAAVYSTTVKSDEFNPYGDHFVWPGVERWSLQLRIQATRTGMRLRSQRSSGAWRPCSSILSCGTIPGMLSMYGRET